MKEDYFDLTMLLERLHRLFLEILKVELDRLKVRDLNNVQTIILYNIGKGQLTVGEISNRGYYLGSNVSYNLKKMVENDYIMQEVSPHDRRSSQVKLSQKGLALYQKIDKVITKQIDNLPYNSISPEDIEFLLKKSRALEGYWSFILSQDLRIF